MPIDLHLHTTASDGTLSPTALVEAAAARGLSLIAVTDHDTLAGLEEAQAAGREVGLPVVPGLELSSEQEGRELHLLGYFVSPDDRGLATELRAFVEARYKRAHEMVSRLNALGVPLSFAEVEREASGGVLARPHVARALFRRGAVSSPQQAFDRWLGNGRPAYVPRYRLSPVAAVQLLAEHGAVAVLAHPGLSRAEHLLPELVAAGLRGIECYHPEHSRAQRRHYQRLVAAYGLLETGGSDSHGPGGTRPVDIGYGDVPDVLGQRLKDAHAAGK